MKIIGFAGSPRRGNSLELLKEALKAAEQEGAETEIIHIGQMKISPCTACDACRKTGRCVIKDDFEKAEQKLREADAIIFSSPVYFGGPTAQIKAMMDRTRPLRRDHALKDKPAGAIAVGASRNGGQETTIHAIHNFFFIHEMLIVGDETTAHYGGTGVARRPEDKNPDNIGLDTSRNLGTHIARITKKLK